MSNVLSIFYEVAVNGRELNNERRDCIDNISIKEDSQGSDTATIVINDPDFLYLEDNIFVEDATISISLGWWGSTYRVYFKGYISAIDIAFPETGFPTLTITCLDSTHLMNREKKKRTWDKMTRPDVVAIIAREYGFGFYKSPYNYEVQETVSQSDQTDIDFIENLATQETEQFRCKLNVKANRIEYVKLGLISTPVATLRYKQYPYNVVSFSPKIDKESKQITVEKSDITTNYKYTDTATASDSNTAREVQGDPVKTTNKPVNTGKQKKYNPVSKTWEDV